MGSKDTEGHTATLSNVPPKLRATEKFCILGGQGAEIVEIKEKKLRLL